jgi:long-chain acyl-CoA synthetase
MTDMTPDTVSTDRAEIEQLIGGRTVADALGATVAAYGDRAAYSDKADGRSEWRTFTWQEMYDAARDVAAALVDLGVEPGRTVAIMASNRIEHLVADMGAMLAGAVPMSIYNTLSPEQIAFIAGQARPAAVFVETPDHLDRWRTALTSGSDALAVVGIGPGVERSTFDDDRLTTWAGPPVTARSTPAPPRCGLTTR